MIRSSPRRPQGNGVNEASHKAIHAALDAVVMDGTRDVQEAVRAAEYLHNTTPHSSLGMSPYEALFGKEPLIPGYQWACPSLEEGTRRQVQAADESLRLGD